MSASDLPQLRSILDKHKENEVVYREKIREINLTRSKVAEQLSALQLTYDRKLKASEQKLETMRSQHDALLRQNILYKAEIDSYQGRLLEKEKIIAMLLNQRKDVGAVGSSDRSKSDKTDSVNANEDDLKNFKKQNGLFKQEMDSLQNYQKPREETPQVERPFLELVSPVKTEKQGERTQAKSVAPPPPPPVKRKAPIVKEVKHEEEPIVEESQSLQSKPSVASVAVAAKEEPKSLPPPPPPKTGGRKVPPPIIKKQEPKPEPIQEPEEVEESSHAFFANISQKQEQQVESKPQTHSHLTQPAHSQVSHEEVYEQQVAQQEEPEAQEQPYEEQLHQEEIAPPQTYYEEPPTETYQEEHEPPQFQAQPEETTQNNFWSNFGQHDQPEEPAYLPKPKPKPASKKKVFKAANFDNEPSNSTDFFSQLGKGETETHPLEIEQSSIDHMDRDNSLLSNEQTYFAQDHALPKPRAVKMAKKKGKRDQIKVVDPSLFA